MESLNILRKSFKEGYTRDLEFRKKQLQSLFHMIDVNEDLICEALKKDLYKSYNESIFTEILLAKREISYLFKNLDLWLSDEKVSKTFVTLLDSTWIQRQPYGVTLCITPWNFPIYLSIFSLAGLMAAGNCVILKPSEISIHTQNLLFELLPKYLDQNAYRVELGGHKETEELLKERFDYILFTGGTKLGKVVMEAAAKHLTPVTLELGGKSPTYIDKDVELKMSAKRIMWSKFTNSGQLCVATDFLICHRDVKELFFKEALETIVEFYSNDPSTFEDYAHIINNNHFSRLMNLIKQTKGKIIVGGDGKEDIRYIAPTIVDLESVNDILMDDEIFGPILPVITVDSADEAIELINNKEKPLSLYIFSTNRAVLKKFEKETTSGSLVFNDCMMQGLVNGLPFGGVGNSGMGAYHGKFSIDQFSHKRAVLDKDCKEIMNNLFRYPPYNKSKMDWVEWSLKSDVKDNSWFCSML